MLPHQYRLPATLRLPHPVTFRTPLFTVRIAKNDCDFNRYGFIIRKATEKRATHRNRIRRLLRSCIEELREEIKPGHDMLFLLEKGIIEKQRDELYKEVSKLLREKHFLIHRESSN